MVQQGVRGDGGQMSGERRLYRKIRNMKLGAVMCQERNWTGVARSPSLAESLP